MTDSTAAERPLFASTAHALLAQVHARLTLGQSLLDRDEFESAVPELLMALQLPDGPKPPWVRRRRGRGWLPH